MDPRLVYRFVLLLDPQLVGRLDQRFYRQIDLRPAQRPEYKLGSTAYPFCSRESCATIMPGSLLAAIYLI